MKKIVSILATIALWLTLTIPAKAEVNINEGNLVQNPTFENNFEHWDLEALSDDYTLERPSPGVIVTKAPSSVVSLSQEVTLPMSGEYKYSVFGFYSGMTEPSSNGKISIEIESKGESFSVARPNNLDPKFDFSISFSVMRSAKVKISMKTQYTSSIFFKIALTRLGDDSMSIKGPNLLKNGGFEDGMAHWTQVGKEYAYTTDSIAFSGKNSLFMGYFTNEPMEHEIQQTISISRKGIPYFVTGTIKTKNLKGGAVLILTAQDQSGQTIKTQISNIINYSDAIWKKAEAVLDVPYETASLTVRILCIKGTGSFYVDDLELGYYCM